MAIYLLLGAGAIIGLVRVGDWVIDNKKVSNIKILLIWMNTWYLILDVWHLTSKTGHLILDILYLISDILYLIPNIWNLIPVIWYLKLNIWSSISAVWYLMLFFLIIDICHLGTYCLKLWYRLTCYLILFIWYWYYKACYYLKKDRFLSLL